MKTRMPYRSILVTLLPLCAVLLRPAEPSAHPVQVGEGLGLEVELVPSGHHDFDYVRAYRDGGELVLYGKVEHRHEAGRVPEGHVDVMFLDGEGERIDRVPLPVVNRGTRRKGWRGAHFRVRMECPGAKAQVLRLLLHDAPLPPEPASPCGAGNRCGP